MPSTASCRRQFAHTAAGTSWPPTTRPSSARATRPLRICLASLCVPLLSRAAAKRAAILPASGWPSEPRLSPLYSGPVTRPIFTDFCRFFGLPWETSPQENSRTSWSTRRTRSGRRRRSRRRSPSRVALPRPAGTSPALRKCEFLTFRPSRDDSRNDSRDDPRTFSRGSRTFSSSS